MYKITVITTTGQIVPEIPCEDYETSDCGRREALILYTEDATKEVARFFDVQGYVVKEVESE